MLDLYFWLEIKVLALKDAGRIPFQYSKLCSMLRFGLHILSQVPLAGGKPAGAVAGLVVIGSRILGF